MSYYFKILISEGQFYKKQNHDELEAAYSDILLFPSLIDILDAKAYHFLRFNYDSKEFILALEDGETSPQAKEEAIATENEVQASKEEQDETKLGIKDGADSENLPSEDKMDSDNPPSTATANGQKSFLSYNITLLEKLRVASKKDFTKVSGKLAKEFLLILNTVVDVLNGVLYGEVGGKFDTVSNLAYLGGSGRSQIFIAALKQYLNDLQSLKRYLEKLMESEAKIVSMME